MNCKRTMLAIGLIGSTSLVGCASMDPEMNTLQAQLSEKEREAMELRTRVDTLQSELAAKPAAMTPIGDSLLPPNAKPGECYARVFVSPRYETVTKTLTHTDPSEQIKVTAPSYQAAEQRVLVREASQKLEVVPARYEWVEERVLAKEASERLVVVPAVYKDVEEQVLVRAAYTTWKPGRGPIERIDEATGEIMCLVDVPAEYQTVVKHVLVTPATTRKEIIPAEYRTVRKQVLVEPATTRTVEIPAQYETVRVDKLVAGAQEQRTTIPGKSQQVSETRLVADGRMEWRPILCETNTTPGVIGNLQQALRSAGYEPGRVDGVLGPQTMRAVDSYQRANGLPAGKLTIETLKRLQVI